MKLLTCLPILLLLTPIAFAADRKNEIGEPGCKVINSYPIPDESIQWSGACKDGYADGKGVLQWFLKRTPNGRYDGEMVKGWPHGMGEMRYSNGSMHKGWFKFGMPNGWGTRYNVMGGSYEGNWKQGFPDGKGTIEYPTGEKQEAQFNAEAIGQAYEEQNTYDEMFYLRQEAPSTGTSLPRKSTVGSRVPYDKSYHELTPIQKRIVKAPYGVLLDADEPPYPVGGKKVISRAMEKAHQRIHAAGELVLEATVGADGTVINVDVLKTHDHDLSKFAAAVLLITKFKPAVCAGKPCMMIYRFQTEFSTMPM